MSAKDYKYIYGPVPSWRLGSSLGVDPLSGSGKVCSFDCLYCQLGKTTFLTDERKTLVPVSQMAGELRLLPPLKIDYITFSGTGEPTLAENLGQMIEAAKSIRGEKTAVLTNSSLIYREDVKSDLRRADFVVAKLDAPSQRVFEAVNKPVESIKFENVIRGMKEFRNSYSGRLALQIMFIEENKAYTPEIARIVRDIDPDEVQINTPLRPCAVRPLKRDDIEMVESYFEGLNTFSVYRAQKKAVASISDEDTLKRRGKI